MKHCVPATCRQWRGLGLVLGWIALAASLPAADLERIRGKWLAVRMGSAVEGLSQKEIQAVDHLVEATRYLDNVYWRQSDPEGLRLYKTSTDSTLRSLLMIYGCRFDLLDENRPFTGSEPMPLGRALYPKGLTRAQIEDYVRKHPEDKAAIYDPYTVVEWRGNRLVGVPYHQKYRDLLERAARELRAAAGLSPDGAFAAFLRLRAGALLSDNYYLSDLAWLDLKDPGIDLIFAPYETYLDDLLGVKTSYGAAVLIRNEAESRRLAVFQKYVPEMQDALPVSPEDRPSKRGHLTPMEVMNAPYRGGDLRHGYQAVADNLPNDPRIHQEKGSKKIFFSNFMDARVRYVILPVAKLLLVPAQAARVSADGYMAGTLLHEISHGLGPAFARGGNKRVDIREAIGPAYSGLEEAKADVVGMFGLKWLVDHGAIPSGRLEEDYASYVAGIFRTLRFGAGEAHGRAEMMEFNYLLEHHALLPKGERYEIDYARMPLALAALAKELLEMEATGDRGRAERWMTRYDVMPAPLQAALRAAGAVPVDIDPLFAFPDRVE
jgi:hypothetical protein